jgi:lysophospholipase L1-like esterase
MSMAQDNLLTNYDFEEPTLVGWAKSVVKVGGNIVADGTTSISTESYAGNQSVLVETTLADPAYINKFSLKSNLMDCTGTQIEAKVWAKTDANGVGNDVGFKFQVIIILSNGDKKYIGSTEYKLTDVYSEYVYTKDLSSQSYADDIVGAYLAFQVGGYLGNYYFDDASFKDGKTIVPKINVLPNDTRIHIKGANFISLGEEETVIHRHSDEVLSGTTLTNRFSPVKARTASGITIRFKTESPKVVAKFKIMEGNSDKSYFGIYQSLGEVVSPEHPDNLVGITPDDVQVFPYSAGAEISVHIDSENPGELVEYKITLPLWVDVNFLGLILDDGYDVVDYALSERPVYVAYGNSITHGRGQNGTYETYAFTLSEWMKWDLYNIAVGGGKTSPVMANMIKDEYAKIDYMTVLIGYNDFNGAGESPTQYRDNYNTFLNTVRKKHVNTKIYCITLTATTKTVSDNSTYTPEDFRQVVRGIVTERQNAGDSNIYLIEGEDITTTADLNDGDPVHMSIGGALNLADKLYDKINETLSNDKITIGELGIEVYPNPVKETLSITSKNKIKKVFVYDMSGKQKEKSDVYSNKVNLSVRDLSDGSYILKIVTSKGITTTKFIK